MHTFHRMTLALLASAILSLAGCQSAGQMDSRTVQNAQQDIQELHSQFLKAFNAKDPTALAAVYSNDAMLMPPNAPTVKTQLGVQEYARQFFSPSISGLLLNVAETTVTGDYAFCTGYYTMLGPDGSSVDHGKFLEVLKREGQGWKIYRDIFNSDMPAAPAAPVAAPAAATH
jgi:uncharacterized protein (TIGR02246 family)